MTTRPIYGRDENYRRHATRRDRFPEAARRRRAELADRPAPDYPRSSEDRRDLEERDQ